jgi:hypothetical protein
MTVAMKAAARRHEPTVAQTAERNWRPFPMTTPSNRANSIAIDPAPNETAVKRARLTGKGTGLRRAGEKGVR